jgi:succinate dehydrogenase hydrophobic anchor subunit
MRSPQSDNPTSDGSQLKQLHPPIEPEPAPESPCDPRTERRNRWSRQMFSAVILSLLLFFVLNIVLQLSPPHYNLVSQAVRDLAVGPLGWLMSSALSLIGLSILIFVAATFTATTRNIRSAIGLLLLGIWGAASLAIGFFPPDIVDAHGYPGSAMAFKLSSSTHVKIHLILASIIFLSMTLGICVTSLGLAKEPELRSLRAPALAISFSLLLSLFLIDPLGVRGIFGIIERSVSLLGFAWVIMIASRLRNRSNIACLSAQA